MATTRTATSFSELLKLFTEKSDDPRLTDMQNELPQVIGIVIGNALLKRKLRKLGLSKSQIYVCTALIGGLSLANFRLKQILDELRQQRYAKSEQLPVTRFSNN